MRTSTFLAAVAFGLAGLVTAGGVQAAGVAQGAGSVPALVHQAGPAHDGVGVTEARWHGHPRSYRHKRHGWQRGYHHGPRRGPYHHRRHW